MPSEFAVEFLKQTYSLHEGSETPKVFLSVGSGYSILTDEIKPMALFNMDAPNLQKSTFGLWLPKGIEMTKVNNSQTFMEQFSDEGDYVKNRLTQLGVNIEVDLKLLNMKSISGFSVHKPHKTSFENTKYSFINEKRIFKVDLRDLSAVPISDNFQKYVNSKLPEIYDKGDQSNWKGFQSFFNSWGHFVISSAYGGGSAEAKISTNSIEDHNTSITTARAELERSFKIISTVVMGGDSRSKGRGFESRRRILDGLDIFSH